uniref:efflux RND transporter periplasmic adaptor subunit n=1 Tax=Actinotalea sp. TaxID=1872145 RepID=UPI0035664EA2
GTDETGTDETGTDETGTDETGTDETGTDETGTLTSCQDAVAQLLSDQVAVAEAQATVDTLATTLDALVAEARDAVAQASGGSTTTPGSSTDPTAGDSSGASSSGSGSASSGSSATSPSSTTGATGASATVVVASAEDLLADQAAIDEAELLLSIAQYELDLVTLTTPIAGTVAAVSLEVGDDVQASSSTAVITVLGEEGYLVTTTLDLTDVDSVHVGQTATATVSSVDEGLGATVTSIGVLNVSTTSTPSYTVVLAVDPSDDTLYDGSSAQLVIDVAAQDATLTVPTSAVHRTDTGATVQQVVDGALVDVEVGIGTVGSERTEISSGLVEGDEVVIADLTAALVSEDDSTESGLSGLGGETSTTTTTPGGVGGAPGGPPQGG